MIRLCDIGIVAHPDRIVDAEWLSETTKAAYLNIDYSRLGCGGNHRKTWKQLAQGNSQWSLVLEDDAVPVDGFLPQLHQVLNACPAPICSLYLGTSRPHKWQKWIKNSIEEASKEDACYITSPRMFHAVAIAMRTPLIASMLAYASCHPMVPIDESVTAWAQRQGHQMVFTHPSLVDHRDGPTVVRHRDAMIRDPLTSPRKAWSVGTRTYWINRVVNHGES